MNIKHIRSQTSQRICSSQAVVSMAAAIKELIENSLDAHSEKIEVRLKYYGADLIEVHDDGDGISSEEFNEFTQRHTTSKIENFEDISNLESFGFRGEALNSLCFLGDVQIHTRSNSNEIGSLLTFDQLGKVTRISPIARQKGTTVFVKNLFHSLPVRRKQFLTNLKREFEKAVKYIIGFCLISDGVQMSCYKIDKNKQLVVSTKGIGGIRGNIEFVFGTKQLNTMTELVTEHNVSQDILEEFNVKDVTNLSKIRLSGFISKPTDIVGSANASKQFLYVNGRPCDLPKIKKLILDCYRNMNKSQIPAFVLAIYLPNEIVDVNVEPDKRMLLLDKQSELFAVIKASILTSFATCGFTPNSRLIDRSLDESMNFLNNSMSSAIADESNDFSPESNSGKAQKRSNSTVELHRSKIPRAKSPDLTVIRHTREVKLPEMVLKNIHANFSLSLLNSNHDTLNSDRITDSQAKFKSKILSNENQKAEDELRRIFHYFNDLDVIGQFNKGFIVARIHSDLFIIDQHASDEKKQFEKLLDQCKVTSQPLVCSQRLNIMPGDEEIIYEHLQLFEKWGFRFKFENSDELSDRIFLIAAPCRNNLILGSNDIQEMIHVIKDSGTCSVMPSRIRTAIASNACRSAVMIGTGLTRAEMKQILANMSTLKDPWSCAHGRPTMRHLHCLE